MNIHSSDFFKSKMSKLLILASLILDHKYSDKGGAQTHKLCVVKISISTVDIIHGKEKSKPL